VAILVIGSGCGKPSPPAAVEIIVDYPDASPKIVDDVVCAPIRQELFGLEHAPTIICVSSNNIAEIYVQATPAMDVATLSRLVDARVQLAAPVLPTRAKIRKVVDVSGQTIPPPLDIHYVDDLRVYIDPQKASRLGVSMSAVSDAMQQAGRSGRKMTEVALTSSTGERIRLSDIATIKTVREPNHIVVRLPN
jgi:multidrug efflux pump subunit AcrB